MLCNKIQGYFFVVVMLQFSLVLQCKEYLSLHYFCNFLKIFFIDCAVGI